MLKAKVMRINNLQHKRPWSGQTMLNLVNMVKKSQPTWNMANFRWLQPLPPDNWIKLKKSFGECRGFGYLSPSLGECARIGTASNSAFV
jgi:hypothetical protein